MPNDKKYIYDKSEGKFMNKLKQGVYNFGVKADSFPGFVNFLTGFDNYDETINAVNAFNNDVSLGNANNIIKEGLRSAPIVSKAQNIVTPIIVPGIKNTLTKVLFKLYNRGAQRGTLFLDKETDKKEYGGPLLYNNNLANTDNDFQQWYNNNTLEGKNHIPYSDNLSYDYYSFFKNRMHQDSRYSIDNHFPDTFKRPSHETFSNESLYSTPENPGGQWNGETFSSKGRFKYTNGGYLPKAKNNKSIPTNTFKSNELFYRDSKSTENLKKITGILPLAKEDVVSIVATRRGFLDNLLNNISPKFYKDNYNIPQDLEDFTRERVASQSSSAGYYPTALDTATFNIFKDLLSKSGDPKINLTGRVSNYNPVTNTINAESVEGLLSEIPHSYQDELFGQNLIFRGIKDWFKSPYLTRNSQIKQYGIKNSLEYEAHSDLETKLEDLYKEKLLDAKINLSLKNNYSGGSSTKDKVIKEQIDKKTYKNSEPVGGGFIAEFRNGGPLPKAEDSYKIPIQGINPSDNTKLNIKMGNPYNFPNANPIIGSPLNDDVKKYNDILKNESETWTDPYKFMVGWYSAPETKARLQKQNCKENPVITTLVNQNRYNSILDWYFAKRNKNDSIVNLVYGNDRYSDRATDFRNSLNARDEENFDRLHGTTAGFHTGDQEVVLTRPDNVKSDQETITHELTHATRLDDFYIDYFKKLVPKNPGFSQSYFNDNPHEIYPRVQDLRYQLWRDGKIVPGVKVTPQMLKGYGTGGDYDIMDYYSPEEMAKIMNEVASTKTTDNQLPKAANGSPIYTSDPNDPRLKAYQDSLALYKSTMNASPVGGLNYFGFRNEQTGLPEGLYGYATKEEYEQQKNLKVNDPINPNKINKNIKPINRLYLANKNSNIPFDIYKKPVQPVVYRKKETETYLTPKGPQVIPYNKIKTTLPQGKQNVNNYIVNTQQSQYNVPNQIMFNAITKYGHANKSWESSGGGGATFDMTDETLQNNLKNAGIDPNMLQKRTNGGPIIPYNQIKKKKNAYQKATTLIKK